MRLARWLITLLLVCLSGPTSPLPLDAPRPTFDAAAPVRVSDGVAHFRAPPDTDGQFVLVVSALGTSSDDFPVSVRLSEFPEPATMAVSPPLVTIRPYRPFPNTDSVANPLVIPAAATSMSPGRRRIFDVPLLNGRPTSNGGSVRVRSHAAAHGQRTVVYLDEAASDDPRHFELAATIVMLLESVIMPVGDQLLGPPADIDGDGRLSILLTPRLAQLQNGRTTVGGFVRSADFRPGLRGPDSNQADMIYLNTNLSIGQDLSDVLSHEYRHVLAFSHRDALGRQSEEDWLNEAMAHMAEPGPTNISHRVQAFLARPSTFPLIVPDYYRAGLWRCDGVRGSSYLFLEWCRQQYGDQLVGRMLKSEKTGLSNLVAATRTPFPRLYRQWSLSLLHGHGPGRCWRPAVRRWDGSKAINVRVASTATTYIVAQKLPAGAMVRIEAPVEARLQVTTALSRSTEWLPRRSTSAAP